MKKNLLFLFLSSIILVAVFVITPAQATPETELGTDPLPSTAQVGTRFNITVTITEILNLYVWQLNMTFNPTVLGVINVTEGSFLKEAAGYPTRWLPPSINNETGWVGAGCSLAQPYPPWGADGSGELAIITFHVKAEGKSDLHFAGVFPGQQEKQQTFLREWDSVAKQLVEILFTPKDGFFQVPQGDVNTDGLVDAVDLAALGKAYGTSEGQPSWNPDADLNKDKVVNIDDLKIFNRNYGAT